MAKQNHVSKTIRRTYTHVPPVFPSFAVWGALFPVLIFFPKVKYDAASTWKKLQLFMC